MIEQMKIGDTFTIDMPDRRRLVRFWCWLTRKPVPMHKEVFKVTQITSGGGWLSVR